ncbi:MAG: methyltransferase domain-containing protein [Candidatus Caldipriscus sp.]|nr:methyltransferase domain-containing protein [Candidatus Caldipriscus sp.]
MYGIDVSSKRLGYLDREVLRFALDWKGSKFSVEFGAGSGRLSLILALLGYRVYIYDLGDVELLNLAKALKLKIFHEKTDIRYIKTSDLPEKISIFVAERVLHYLRFEESRRVLARVIRRMEKGGRLFLSLSGINSPIGKDYEHRDFPVEKRFCLPSREVMEKFKIDVPICLYDIEDLRRLLDGFPVREVKLRSTAFGNVEGIFEKVG